MISALRDHIQSGSEYDLSLVIPYPFLNIIKVYQEQIIDKLDVEVNRSHLLAVVLTTAGTQRATETNTYLKMNWGAIVMRLITRFAEWAYQSLWRFGPLINGMHAIHDPLQKIRWRSTIGVTP
jgi:hypothetical protein